MAIAAGVLLALSACGQEPAAEPGDVTGGPEPAPALPDLARVVCEADGTRVETPAVRPRGDGIHVELVNETGAERSFAATSAEGGGLGVAAPTGKSVQVLDLEPGALTVACPDPGTGEGDGAPLEIVDENGIWVSTLLDCGQAFSQVVDFAPDARGETSDPVEAARTALEGYRLEPDDVLEPAGYPETELPKVRLVRDGEVLAVVQLVDDGAGMLLVSMLSGCSSLER